MKIPLLSDLTHQISKDYGVFLEDQGHTLRCAFPSTLTVFFLIYNQTKEIILLDGSIDNKLQGTPAI